MKQIVKYTAIDPYYSDQEQTYIGATPEEVRNIRSETEEFMSHGEVLSRMYKVEEIFDDTCPQEWG